MHPVLLWFRRDLRLSDNPALAAALKSQRPILPIYILDETPGLRPLGAASRWWLDKSLKALGDDLQSRGSKLLLRRGVAADILADLVQETGATDIFFNALFEPKTVQRDRDLAEHLREKNCKAHRFNGGHLLGPDLPLTKTGGGYSVFTPYWRAARGHIDVGMHVPAPDTLGRPERWPASEALASWALHPSNPDWSSGFSDWTPGEAAAAHRLTDFVDLGLSTYSQDRDIPSVVGTSCLSPHLAFGEISPKTCWRAAVSATHRATVPEVQAEKFLAELGWREFNTQIASRHEDLALVNFSRTFDRFTWREDPDGFRAWTRGETGYPIVDAGMRQLWKTGWMHNRVRMVVASFLTKHLMIDWRLGEQWFWDTLVDADLASNPGNWQWVAGSGADAAPYFRIFSPMAQGAKFDPAGHYVSRWVPELRRLPAKLIHSPWLAPQEILSRANVRLGFDYPVPIVDHDFARKRALGGYAGLKGS